MSGRGLSQNNVDYKRRESMKKIMLFGTSVILWIMFSSIPCMAGNEGVRLDLNRINTGSYVASGEKKKVISAGEGKISERKQLSWWERLKKWQPFKEKKGLKKELIVAKSKAEAESKASKKVNEAAQKVKAIAETSLEVSKKAERTAIEALNAAKKAEAVANESIAAANRAIEAANKSVANTNNAIDKINKLAEKLKRERAEEKKKKEVKTYRVKRGDSLITIAAKPSVYGNGALWKKLFNANRDKIKNPNIISPGLLLKVPK